MSRKKNKKKKSRFARIVGGFFSVILTLMLIGIITGILVVGAFGIYARDHLIDSDFDIKDLQFSLDMTTTIYYPEYADIERTELVRYVEMEDQRLHGSQNRFWAPIQDMPKDLQNAFIAIEDKRFYENNGIDLHRTLGATLMFMSGSKSYGGSTITQQLIKNITGERDSTIQRKVTEISRAISLTKKHTKKEILEMYLNTISLSHGCYGVAAAAGYFFDKEVSDLTLVECAALAAIPKSPTKYDPLRNPEFNRERRNDVLWTMHEQGLISDEDYEEAIDTELVLNIKVEEPSSTVQSYFTDALRAQVQEDLMEHLGCTREIASDMILAGGLKIYATVDPYIQSAMEDVYADESTFVKVDDGVQPESAMVVLDPRTGDVLGIVGGRGRKTANLTLNRATKSPRQIGSSIKPISVYAPAIDLGLINYGSCIDDTPVEFNRSMGRYWPKNAPAVYEGKIPVRYALSKSKNTAAVKIVMMLSPEYSYNFLTEKLGVTTLVKSDIDRSPMALGGLTYGMTTLEVAGAYSMLANDGIYSKPRFYTKVLDSKDNVILDNTERHNVVIEKSTAQIMTKLMTGVVNQGTGTAVTLRRKIDVAGKTGTTNKNYDVYFVGYTPYYLGATWFGYDQNRSLARFGTNQALVGWDKVMTKIHQRVFEQEKTLRTFDYSTLTTAKYCRDSGKKPSPLCYLDIRGSRVETGYYKRGGEPSEVCDVHTVVRWDRETKSIASDRCPEEDVGEIVLVKVGEERNFKHPVSISDAQYTVMELPDGYVYPTERNTAIYSNLVTYYGYRAATAESVPVNSYCTVHAYAPEEPVEPDVPDVVPGPDTEAQDQPPEEHDDNKEFHEIFGEEGDKPSEGGENGEDAVPAITPDDHPLLAVTEPVETPPQGPDGTGETGEPPDSTEPPQTQMSNVG